MIGSISKLKGIFQFLKAIKKGKNRNHFLISDQVVVDILTKVKKGVNKLKKLGQNITLGNEFLTNREFAKIIEESDILVMPYLSKGTSSGILGHTALNNIAVVGTNKRLLANTIINFGMTVTKNPKDLNQFSKYINNPQKVTTSFQKKSRALCK